MKNLLNKIRNNRPRSQSEILRGFHELYWYGQEDIKPWTQTKWLGVPALKCPLDLWMYQQIIHETRPAVIVETGVNEGGSSLFLASMLDLLGGGKVIACDITLAKVSPIVKKHPRITLVEGSSIGNKIVSRISNECADQSVMVILDSDHSYKHVREELNLYSKLVTVGNYLICEDSNVNGHPVYPDHGPGPFEAVEEFIRENTGWYIDHSCERFLLTFNPSGYLKRQA